MQQQHVSLFPLISRDVEEVRQVKVQIKASSSSCSSDKDNPDKHKGKDVSQ